MALLLAVVVIMVAAALYHFILYPLFLSPIAGVPAVHPFAKISSLYMLWTRFWDVENAVVFAAHQKHGEVVQLGPHELSVNCVDDGIKTIYGRNFDRHSFYRVYEDCGRRNLSSSLDAFSHTVRKRRITHVYSKSYLQNSPAVAALISKVVRDRFLSLVTECAEAERPFDTMITLSALALDMVLGYTYGLKNGTNFLNDKEEHAKCIGRIHTGRPYPMMFWLHEFPGMVSLFEKMGILSTKRYESLEALHVFCLDMCRRTEAALKESKQVISPEDYPTVYQQLRRALDTEGLSSIPAVEVYSEMSGFKSASYSPQQLEIAAEVGDQIHASDETLSITLTYAIWELSRNVDTQKRLRHECQALGNIVRADSKVDLPSAGIVDQLPLLHAIIMETMRVHPVVAGGQARVTPYGKLSKLGQYDNIPGGYRVQSYARFLHHNPDVFPDALTWRPERWLRSAATKEQEGVDQKMRWFWAFSSGGRMCLGSHFALFVMKYALLLLYANFETHIVDDGGIEHMEGYVGGPKSGRLMVGVMAAAWPNA